jgi:hypothetical protein
MKVRTLAILLVIMAVFAGAGILVVRMHGPEKSGGDLGKPLLKHLEADKITNIGIKGPKGTVSLARMTDLWVVTERNDYPADFSRIIDLVRRLKSSGIGREFDSSDRTLRRLALKDPEDSEARETEKGTRVQLYGKNGLTLASVLLGKIREGAGERGVPGGQYVRLGQDSTVYLIDNHFTSFESDPTGWIEKRPVQVEADEVKRVACLNADGKTTQYFFEREQEGDEFQLMNLPSGSKIKTSVVNRVAGALSSLRIEDVLDPSAASNLSSKTFDTLFEFTLFSGMIYRVSIASKVSEGATCYLKIEADYRREALARTKEAGEGLSEVPKGAQKTDNEYALETQELNARLSPWVYVIPGWQRDAFVTNPGQLFEASEDVHK